MSEKPDDGSNISIELSERLAAVRIALELSLRAMAEELGVSKTKLGDAENGKAPVTAQMIHILHEKYGVSFDWFFKGVGEMFDADSIEETTERVSEEHFVIEDIRQAEIVIESLKDYIARKKREDADRATKAESKQQHR